MFSWIATYVANDVVMNPNGSKSLVANGLSTQIIKDNLVFSKVPKDLHRNPPDCPILSNWVNFILANELL